LQLDFDLAFLLIMDSQKTNLLFTNEVADALETKLSEESFSMVFVLVDENTERHCLRIINKSLPEDYQLIVIKPGEENKTLATCEIIWQELTSANSDRHALVINLGGGVICDMGGFCARTYKRGIQFWNIPTTLLSQVDASVGGKLGVDFGVFKNHIGLFSEPDMVFIDSVFFNTLPEDEIVSGYAEMVKHALISDGEMFIELQEENLSSIDWQKWVPKSVAIKKAVVELDPTEKGLRKILNFGHTIGHAIESYHLDKSNSLKHGEAIAIGMIAETYLSHSKNLLSENDRDKVIQYLLKVFPQQEISENAIDPIISLALQDKKNIAGSIKAVLLNAIGEAVIDIEITENDISSSLNYYNQLIK
jgi:3-dehydroquinate synthase